MNRRKASAVRRVVPGSEVVDDDAILPADEVEAAEKTQRPRPPAKPKETKKPESLTVVVAQVHAPGGLDDKDDNQNYMSSLENSSSHSNDSSSQQESQDSQTNKTPKGTATNPKTGKKGGPKVSLSAVLARLNKTTDSPEAVVKWEDALKDHPKTSTPLAATASPKFSSTALSAVLPKPGRSAPKSPTKSQASQGGKGKKRRTNTEPDAESTEVPEKTKKKRTRTTGAVKKTETMKASTKLALMAKISQNVGAKDGDSPSTPTTQARILPPAPPVLYQTSPLPNPNVLGTCTLYPVKKEPIDLDDADARQEDLFPLDLSMCSKNSSLPAEPEPAKKQTGKKSSKRKAADDGNKSKKVSKAKMAKAAVTESSLIESPVIESQVTAAEEKRSSVKQSAPTVSTKKTGKKNVKDANVTPQKVESETTGQTQSEAVQAEDLTKLSKPTNSNVRQEREEGTILNKTTIEGSNTQIIVKQENNDIVIRIEQDKSPANQSMLNMSPNTSVRIAKVVDKVVRAAASKARLLTLALSDEEGDENTNVSPNMQVTTTPPMGKGERPKECPICGKVFNRGGNLAGHMRKHTGERPYVCDICNKGFTFLTNLRAHMNVHTGERPYKCKLCDKAYTQLCGLQRHMASHSDEKPFVCPTCKKAFKHLHVLRRHELVHSEYRPYRCTTCSKGFLHAWHLEKHVRVHTGQRPFKCPDCNAAFTQEAGLRSHVNRVHLNIPDDGTATDEEEENVEMDEEAGEESETSAPMETDIDTSAADMPSDTAKDTAVAEKPVEATTKMQQILSAITEQGQTAKKKSGKAKTADPGKEAKALEPELNNNMQTNPNSSKPTAGKKVREVVIGMKEVEEEAAKHDEKKPTENGDDEPKVITETIIKREIDNLSYYE